MLESPTGQLRQENPEPVEPQEEREGRPLTLHLLRMVPTIIILGLLVHFLLPRLGTIEDSLETMKTMAPWAIAIAIIFETLSYLANGNLLQSVVVLAGDRISLRRAAAIEIGAATVSLVAAGALGFGAAIFRWTRSGGVSRDTAMLASWLPSVFDSVTLVLFALASAIELLHVHRLARPTAIALTLVISVLSIVIVGLIVLLVRSDWLMAIALKAAQIIKRIRPGADENALPEAAERAAHAWQQMSNRGWVHPAVSSLLVLTFDLLCLRYAFLATGTSLHFSVLVAGYGVPILLGRSSFLPGGIAVIEVAMAAVFGGLGVPASVAVVGVLTYRLISFWLPAAIGIPIAVALQSRKFKRPTP